jgi:hypothetical protein
MVHSTLVPSSKKMWYKILHICSICSNLTPFGEFSVNKKDHKHTIICAPNPPPNPPSTICISLSLEVDKREERPQNFLVSAGVGTSTMAGTQKTHQISNPHITSLTIRKLTTSPTPPGSCNVQPTPCEQQPITLYPMLCRYTGYTWL